MAIYTWVFGGRWSVSTATELATGTHPPAFYSLLQQSPALALRLVLAHFESIRLPVTITDHMDIAKRCRFNILHKIGGMKNFFPTVALSTEVQELTFTWNQAEKSILLKRHLQPYGTPFSISGS
ncbi:hypothetical protein F4W66_11050 [Escherichia coli]|nr:hypothetical protein F4W66_11050 [Escherichia coli]